MHFPMNTDANCISHVEIKNLIVSQTTGFSQHNEGKSLFLAGTRRVKHTLTNKYCQRIQQRFVCLPTALVDDGGVETLQDCQVLTEVVPRQCVVRCGSGRPTGSQVNQQTLLLLKVGWRASQNVSVVVDLKVHGTARQSAHAYSL